ncbi:MAG: Beta-lactamase class C-like and penicillin binding proteins (PBPs) superfamily [uncultured Rubrobacteraceae bacterium]|uniref:Beta-lactamase class C-like and penicillin binding proteins (PBPs) superfamily n=1 Tax=uncultured Rubrobacteraceae bacterium TaxID=349277 RepID=A0A6J4T8H5_9ACTN|nr:MAG: Beta-lactamase class C-like and penicillin binding proteins (PBPs) superfamily [uncultured Rubrobacteraceae bacterium]
MPRRMWLSSLLALAAAWIFLAACSPGLAQTPGPTSTPEDSSGAVSSPLEASSLRTDDVEGFMDEKVPEQLEELRVPGAAVSVVADGRQVFAKGYGLADTENGRPTVTERTAFPINSVSKVFTATAVMQLVEQGKLDLDTDVNEYLTEFEIRDTYPGNPVTLRHLLTHTAGFEDPLIEPGNGGDSPGLGAYLADRQPERVRPPGQVHSYSDYGFELAGYLVQVRSGVPFERYVEQRIFVPLGMTSTTFGAERGHDNEAPSVGVVSTAPDMSRFMLAHLGNGAVGGERILGESTAKLMQRRQFGHDPRLPGLTFPFFEADPSGRRLLGHSGEGPGSHSMLSLLPEEGVGMFVTYNGDGPSEHPLFDGTYRAREDLRNDFVATFFPGSASPPPPATQANLDRYAGTYRWTKLRHRDPALLLALLTAPDLRVTAHDRNGLTTTGFTTDPDRTEQVWEPVGKGVFREKVSGEKLAFVEDDDGEPVLAATSYNFYSFAFERMAWYESLTPHLIVAGGALLLVSTMLVWPVTALARRSRRTTEPHERGRAARRIAAATGVLLAGSIAGLQYLHLFAGGGSTALLIALQAASAVGAVGAVASCACAGLAWRRRWWGRLGTAHYTATAAALVALFVLAYYYGLLG